MSPSLAGLVAALEIGAPAPKAPEGPDAERLAAFKKLLGEPDWVGGNVGLVCDVIKKVTGREYWELDKEEQGLVGRALALWLPMRVNLPPERMVDLGLVFVLVCVFGPRLKWTLDDYRARRLAEAEDEAPHGAQG